MHDQQGHSAQPVVDGEQDARVEPVREPAGPDGSDEVEDADEREQRRGRRGLGSETTTPLVGGLDEEVVEPAPDVPPVVDPAGGVEPLHPNGSPPIAKSRWLERAAVLKVLPLWLLW